MFLPPGLSEMVRHSIDLPWAYGFAGSGYVRLAHALTCKKGEAQHGNGTDKPKQDAVRHRSEGASGWMLGASKKKSITLQGNEHDR